MIAPDVNVLIYAFHENAPDHERYVAWLEAARRAPTPLILFEPVLAGVIRILTNPHAMAVPAPAPMALAFVEQLAASPSTRLARPGERHFAIFLDLCRRTNARGNLVPDAYLAALAIEHNCDWITADRDFARFPGLRWRHPLS